MSLKVVILILFLSAALLASQDRYEPILAKIRAGNLAAAEDELHKIVEASPQDGLAHFYLGTVYATRREYVAAMSAYREAARLHPKDARFHIALGLVYKDTGMYDQAIEALKAGTVLDPTSAQAHFALGSIYHIREKDQSAIKELELGLRHNPNSLEAMLMLADASVITSAFNKAKTTYQRVIQRDANNVHAHFGLASIDAMNPEAYGSAVEHLQKAIALEPRNFEATHQLGLLYVKMNRDRDAFATFQTALDINPDSATTHLALGRLLLKAGAREKGEKRLQKYRELTAQQDSQKKASRHAKELLQQGRELAWQNRLREAAEKFHEALSINLESGAAHAMLCKIYLSMSDMPRARGHIARALELESYNAEYHYLLGLVLKDEKKLDEAIAELKQSIVLNPEFADAYNIVGNLYSDLHRYAEAVPHYLKTIALEPKAPEPHLNLAAAYRQLDRAKDSERELAIYRKLK